MSDTLKPDATGNLAAEENMPPPVLNIHSLYLKDVSFEAPRSPEVFNQEWKPKLDFDLQMATRVLSEADDIYEVVLHVTVTVTVEEDGAEKPAFLIEIQQAGAFTVKYPIPEVVQYLLASDCPAILFPYVREMVSNLATRGGFPQLVLPPVNFEALYHQKAEQAIQDSAAGSTERAPLQ